MREYIEILQASRETPSRCAILRRHPVARLQYRNLDGALKTEQIGAAVTLDDDAVQSDHVAPL
jgi:hypothetical protein